MNEKRAGLSRETRKIQETILKTPVVELVKKRRSFVDDDLISKKELCVVINTETMMDQTIIKGQEFVERSVGKVIVEASKGWDAEDE